LQYIVISILIILIIIYLAKTEKSDSASAGYRATDEAPLSDSSDNDCSDDSCD